MQLRGRMDRNMGWRYHEIIDKWYGNVSADSREYDRYKVGVVNEVLKVQPRSGDDNQGDEASDGVVRYATVDPNPITVPKRNILGTGGGDAVYETSDVHMEQSDSASDTECGREQEQVDSSVQFIEVEFT